MARPLIGNAALWGALNAQLSNACQKLLPAASSTGMWRGLGQQQQQNTYSSCSSTSTSHSCTPNCNCSRARTPAAAGSAAVSFEPSNSTWLAFLSNSSSSARLDALTSHTRGFASFTRASAHAGCGHSHHHDEPCADEATTKIREAPDLQQLQQLVDDTSASMGAGHAAAAFRRAAVLADKTPAAAAALVKTLGGVWPGVLPQAGGREIGDVLLAWTKLQLQDAALWGPTLAAMPAQIGLASGQDLANVAYALAAMSDINGGIPGVPRPDVEELLRAITKEVVELVQGKGAGDGEGGGAAAGGRSVSVGNLATVRWAHEVFEESAGGAAAA